MAVSEQMWERFKSLRQYMEKQPKNLENIKEWLCEKEWIPGAYCCSYPGFIDCYRMEARAAERRRHQGILMVCTIRDRQGIAVAEEENSRSIWTSWISAYVRRYGEVTFIPDTTENRY